MTKGPQTEGQTDPQIHAWHDDTPKNSTRRR